MAEDPNEWVRIKDKDTKHESTVARMSVRPDQHEILDKDAADANGNPLPNKPYIAKGGPPARAVTEKEAVK